MKKVDNEKDLGAALNAEEDEIEIVGDLAARTIRIRAAGKVAWAVAAGAIAVAVIAALSIPATGGAGTPVAGSLGAAAAAASVGVLGGAATYSAIAIAIAAGGVGVLTRLRGYREVSRSKNSLVLKRVS